jgi:hypothetical protein
VTPLRRGTRLAAGFLAIFFYMARASLYLATGEPYNLLWSCHLACLLVGFGFLLSSPTLNAIGFLWVTVGLPFWFLDLATGGRFMPSSLLTHFGGFALGFFGIRTLGMPAGAWWKAILALAGLQLLTRAVNSPAGNVNLAFGVWSGWEPWFPSHGVYLLMLGALSAAVFFLTSLLLRGFAR